MVCVWVEGFETHVHVNQLERKYATVAGSITAQAGRVFGTSGGPLSSICTTPSFGVNNTFVLGVGFQLSTHTASINGSNSGFYVELGANEQCHVEIESVSGSGFRFHIISGASTVDTTGFFDFGVWHYFEFKFTVRTGTDGAYEVRNNGVVDISGTSVDLANTGGDGWDVFSWRYGGNFSSVVRMDDMYVLNGSGVKNNDFLGPSVVEGVLPNANGATIQWTNNGTGDNFTSVDDAGNAAPDESGSGGTVGSDVNGQKDLYAMQDLQQITGAIHAVQLGVQLGMAATGSRTVKTKYRDPDTSEADGSSHVVDSTEFDEFTEVFDDNPASAASWDIADIDGGQFGIEVVS